MRQDRDWLVEELEKAFQPRERKTDGTAFKFNIWTVIAVVFCGVVMAAIALPLYFGHATPDSSYVEGMFISTSA